MGQKKKGQKRMMRKGGDQGGDFEGQQNRAAWGDKEEVVHKQKNRPSDDIVVPGTARILPKPVHSSDLVGTKLSSSPTFFFCSAVPQGV